MTALAATTFAAAVVPAFELYRHLYRVLSYDSGAPPSAQPCRST